MCAATGTEYTYKGQSRFVHSNTLIFKSEIYSVSIVCGSVPKKKIPTGTEYQLIEEASGISALPFSNNILYMYD